MQTTLLLRISRSVKLGLEFDIRFWRLGGTFIANYESSQDFNFNTKSSNPNYKISGLSSSIDSSLRGARWEKGEVVRKRIS